MWLRLAPLVFLLFWSAGFTFAKIGVAHAEPITFLALRFALCLAVLLPLFLVLRPPLPATRAAWGHLVMVGLLIQSLYFGLAYYAFAIGMSAGTVALIASLQPILVALLAPSLAGEKVSTRQWSGLALGLVGAVLVIASRAAVEFSSWAGLACAFGAMFAMTAATLYEKRFGTTHHPVTANLIQYAVGFATTLPLALAVERLYVDWHPELLVALTYLVLCNSLIAITLLLALIRRNAASRVSALFYLVPPTAALIAWLIIGERMPPAAWIGTGFAAAGVALACWPVRRPTA